MRDAPYPCRGFSAMGHSKMQRIAFIFDPDVIAAMFESIGHAADSPVAACVGCLEVQLQAPIGGDYSEGGRVRRLSRSANLLADLQYEKWPHLVY